uniref:Uncharacterized protein n=1 Tax=Dulem virus 101 TaxID=3145578 RepID=A0AAU8B8J3_9VIRU
MKFKTQWTCTPSKGEVNSGEVKVDPAGYLPAHVVIQNFLVAGQALNVQRAGYDIEGDDFDFDEVEDPTRAPDYDIADASQASLAIEERLDEARAIQKAQAEEAATKKAETVPASGEGGEAQ